MSRMKGFPENDVPRDFTIEEIAAGIGKTPKEVRAALRAMSKQKIVPCVFNTKQCAAYFGVSVRELLRARARGESPPFVQYSGNRGKIVWLKETMREWTIRRTFVKKSARKK